jgi:hypothetical protein
MKVNILGKSYLVKFIKEIPGHPDCAGICCPETNTIYILSTLKAEKKKEVLYHEIIHAVIEESGVAQSILPQIEEVICDTVGKTFARLKKIPGVSR